MKYHVKPCWGILHFDVVCRSLFVFLLGVKVVIILTAIVLSLLSSIFLSLFAGVYALDDQYDGKHDKTDGKDDDDYIIYLDSLGEDVLDVLDYNNYRDARIARKAFKRIVDQFLIHIVNGRVVDDLGIEFVLFV